MKEAVDYAVAQMKKEGFLLDPVASRRMVRYMIDYILDELVAGNPVTLTGFGTFTSMKMESEKRFMPALGREIITRPKTKVKFEPSRRFRLRLKGELSEEDTKFNLGAMEKVRAKNPLLHKELNENK